MSGWTSPAALRAQLMRRWDKGELLAELAVPGDLFPLRLVLRGPSSVQLSERFDAARTWAADLRQGARSAFRLVMREVRHRVIGQNSLPAEAWVDTVDDALRLIGRTRDASRPAGHPQQVRRGPAQRARRAARHAAKADAFLLLTATMISTPPIMSIDA